LLDPLAQGRNHGQFSDPELQIFCRGEQRFPEMPASTIGRRQRDRDIECLTLPGLGTFLNCNISSDPASILNPYQSFS
jgi:hypothetical protein